MPARGFGGPTSVRWPLARSSDLFELRYGKALVEASRRPGSVPVFGTNGQCGWHDSALFRGPGVVLGRKGQGPLGVVWVDSDYWVIDTAYSLSPLRDDLNLKFSYYLIKYVGLNHLKDGTSNPTLSRDAFGAQLFPLPPLPQQRAIADILGIIDDKIELNRRTNETLEAMARALFKSWFVDFDPVRAKAEGRQPSGMDVATAKLFPSELEDSDVGLIPKGWRIQTIEDVCQRVGMGPFGSSIKVSTFVGEGVPVISGQHLHGALLEDGEYNFISEEHAEALRNSNVVRGDLVFTHAGTLGQVAYVPERSKYERYVISQRQFYLRPNLSKLSPHWLLYYFRSPGGQHALLANTSSTGVPSISRPVSYLKTIRVVTPPKALDAAFSDFVRALHLTMQNNARTSETLASIRDSLLPKLLSGELTIPNAERFLGDLDKSPAPQPVHAGATP